jgi:hypothetical protein
VGHAICREMQEIYCSQIVWPTVNTVNSVAVMRGSKLPSEGEEIFLPTPRPCSFKAYFASEFHPSLTERATTEWSERIA